MTGEYYSRNEKELVPFQPPLPSTPYQGEEINMSSETAMKNGDNQLGGQANGSESTAPIISHMSNFQFTPTLPDLHARTPKMEIKFSTELSIPESANINPTGEEGEGKGQMMNLTTDHKGVVESEMKAMSEQEQQEENGDSNRKEGDGDGEEKGEEGMKLLPGQAIVLEVKTSSKQRHVISKHVKSIPTLAQIEKITGQTKKGLPACFVGKMIIIMMIMIMIMPRCVVENSEILLI